jgi:hypothetical protein
MFALKELLCHARSSKKKTGFQQLQAHMVMWMRLEYPIRVTNPSPDLLYWISVHPGEVWAKSLEPPWNSSYMNSVLLLRAS